jgi:hypothetical protein
VVGKNDNLLPIVNFRLQLNRICLVVTLGLIKARHVSLFNKIYKYIKNIKYKTNIFPKNKIIKWWLLDSPSGS